MSRASENTFFICGNCQERVTPLTNGSFRNHCPFCLYSKHVDAFPGDRKHVCQGLMKPVGIKHHTKKGYQIIHKCLGCGEQKVNKVAECTEQPDRIELILALMQAN